MADFLGSTLQGIMNPRGIDIQPGISQLLRSDQIGRGIGRQDAALQQQNSLRESGSSALAVLNQPAELRQQALSGLANQFQQSGNQPAAEAMSRLMQMDEVGLDTALKDLVFKASDQLPAGALQGVTGGRSGFQTNAPIITEQDGQKFFTSLRTNRSTGEQEAVSIPISGTITDKLGLSAGDRVNQAQQEAIAKSSGKALGEAGTSTIAAQTAGKIETAKEKGKQTQQLNFRPRIQKAVAKAKAAGDDEEKLAALNANIPLVNEMADKLRALSSDATHTFGGRAFDFLAKESGFGATKGSTARAKYQAIIDNQVLPLLKATFGAAFTAAEGERLAATLGDVNAAPAEKMAQLDAFLDSQQSQITGLERKLNPEAADANVGDLSDEDLFN